MSQIETVRDKRTKIVCTIGPGTDAPGVLERMIAAGMNVARFNFSHGAHAEHAERMAEVRRAAARMKTTVGILLDTKGPEMRIGTFAEDQVVLEQGSKFCLHADEVVGDASRVTISYPELWKEVSPGQSILLADGLVRLLVKQAIDGVIETEVENTGVISHRKRVACPDIPLRLPALSVQDRKDLQFGIAQDIDYVAASFIQRPEDVVEIKQFLEANGGAHIRVLAKIENREGVRNLESILRMADGLMVARGDLGVEIPAEQVPMIQKEMIRMCNHAGKPVITATQMLESMIENPRPTRAETSDIANAILDGTDAVMLSGETANGKYPVAAVETMLRVALSTERSEIYRSRLRETVPVGAVTTEAISFSTAQISEALRAKAIISASESGRTALMVSKYRPFCPVLAISPHERTLRRCTLYWGVVPLLGQSTQNSDEMVEGAMHTAMLHGAIDTGDLVVITAGVPSGREGSTNMIRVHVAGTAMIRGTGLGNGRAVGRVVVADDQLQAQFMPGDVLVFREWQAQWLPYVEQAGALIAEESGLTCPTAVMGLSHDIPTVVGVAGAMETFRNGETVTVDAVRGLIFNGSANAR